MWDTTLETPGRHVLTARAVSRDGQVAEKRVTVVVAPV